ncbi:hypothetical protein [Actinosynnema sp. NPDC023587]|uniref:hypothetical protein n=1 Tax=Actinosynnema sp. NPDC023587 TaxID=3154695 RepID=UPI0033C13EEC
MTSADAAMNANDLLHDLTRTPPTTAEQHRRAAGRLLWHATNLAAHWEEDRARTFAALSEAYLSSAAAQPDLPAGQPH